MKNTHHVSVHDNFKDSFVMLLNKFGIEPIQNKSERAIWCSLVSRTLDANSTA
jgi:hypothetical protein